MQEWELTGPRSGVYYTANLGALQESDDVRGVYCEEIWFVSAFGFEDLRDRAIE